MQDVLDMKPVTATAIKYARERLGDTQAQFAERIGGIDQATVSRWEAGRVPKTGVTQAFLQRRLAELARVVVRQ